jgi:hypothetical protein
MVNANHIAKRIVTTRDSTGTSVMNTRTKTPTLKAIHSKVDIQRAGPFRPHTDRFSKYPATTPRTDFNVGGTYTLRIGNFTLTLKSLVLSPISANGNIGLPA